MSYYNNTDCVTDVEAVHKASIVHFYRLNNSLQKTRFWLRKYIYISSHPDVLTITKHNDKQTGKLGRLLLISSGKYVQLGINN